MPTWGNSARRFATWAFTGELYSFEPTSAAFKELSKPSSADPQWSVFNLAIGAEDGVAEINIASNDAASSSLMPMNDSFMERAPHIKYIGAEKVQVRTLDSALAGLAAPDETLMLKMDVQGFEHLILRGATSTLAQVPMIECELSFTPLYEGQFLFPQMLELFNDLGFHLVGLSPINFADESGYFLQADGTFVRKQ